MKPHTTRSALLAIVACLATTSCGDPKREEQLRWREDEVQAKLTALAQREAEFAKEKNQITEALRQMEAREKAVAHKEKNLLVQLAEETEKLKKVRHEIEIKNLRGPVPIVSADRSIVIDPVSDDVLFEKNADKRGAIASTTKIMTGLLIVEAGSLDQMVTIEKSDTQCAPVRLGIKEGETYTRQQLLTAVLVKSSNDIAQALARDNAGSVTAFVEKMNAKAKGLGLQNTHFVNPHGLPGLNEDQPYSTARELAVITKMADKLPEIRQIVKRQTYKFKKPDGRSIDLTNTNRVLRTTAYCDGMKTGYTDAAGYCLVATGERNGRRRIVVVLNDTESGVWRDAQALLDWALKA
ncbi:MAG: serine hydrolase [Prosthecobacter sp.]